MTKRIPFIDNFCMALLLISPILGIYGNKDGWNYATKITLPLSCLYFAFYFFEKKNVFGKQNPLPQGLLSYFLYWSVLTTITCLTLPKAEIQAYFAFFLFFSTFHLDSFISKYKIFTIVCLVFFVIQEITFHVTGVRVSGLISSLPFYDGDMSVLLAKQAMASRSCSFFSEPAHFAQVLIPLLAIELYYDKNKKHYLFAAIVGVSLLFLGSGNGLIGMMAVLAFSYSYFKIRTKWMSMLFFTIIVLIIGYYFLTSELGNAMMERQGELASVWDGQSSRSGFLRVWRGYYVYNDYDFFEKLFGCPNSLIQLAHVKASGMLMVGGNSELYFNAIQKILLNTGLIGIAIFVYVIAKIWKGNTICGKALLSALVALSLIAGIYMSSTMILYLVLAQGMKKSNCQ